MGTKIYKVDCEFTPTIEVGEKEIEFLSDFIIDYHAIIPPVTHYFVDEELLDEAGRSRAKSHQPRSSTFSDSR